MFTALLPLLIIFAFGDAVRVRVMVPKFVKSHSAVTLVCQYDLGGKPLYAVKWYRGNHEFFRYVPQDQPAMISFPGHGLNVDLPGSSAHQVTLLDVPANISGIVTCEVSTDITFSTASDSAYMNVLDADVKKPSLQLSRSVTGTDGDFLIKCSAQITDPLPSITFYIDGMRVDPSVVRHIEPGIAALSLSGLDPRFFGQAEESDGFHDFLDKFEKPIRVRCEASVKGIYLVSSSSIPIIPQLRRAPVELDYGEGATIAESIGSSAFSSRISSILVVTIIFSQVEKNL